MESTELRTLFSKFNAVNLKSGLCIILIFNDGTRLLYNLKYKDNNTLTYNNTVISDDELDESSVSSLINTLITDINLDINRKIMYINFKNPKALHVVSYEDQDITAQDLETIIESYKHQ